MWARLQAAAIQDLAAQRLTPLEPQQALQVGAPCHAAASEDMTDGKREE